jgi:CPA1 family monovalent cation:H+ antiporter
MHTTIFDTVAILFVIAAVFAYGNHKLFKLPFAIGIMVAELLASLLVLAIDAFAPGLGLSELVHQILADVDFAEALMHGMLSFLLFAGALHTDMDTLKRWAMPIGILASVGVLISTFLIGFGAYGVFSLFGFEVPMLYCLVFGALITPTDPVAVLGIMKAAGAPKAVEIKVIGESLFNDGVGVVVFTVLLAIASGGGGHGGEMGALEVLKLIGIEVIGGVALGLISGYFTYLSLRSLEEPNLETLISVALVMGITFVAFQLHTSAPLACVVAGLFIGNQGRHDAMSDPTEEAVDTVWSFIDEALNAILFLLVGVQVVFVTFNIEYAFAALFVIVLAIASRAAAVFMPMEILGRHRPFLPGTSRMLWWGGIKGGISIALALSLPPFEGRELILTSTYAVVIVSVLLQGLTIGGYIQRLTENPDVETET